MKLFEWIQKVNKTLTERRPIAGKGMSIERTPKGTIYSASAESVEQQGGVGLKPILIQSIKEYNAKAQKVVYNGKYCSDFDGVMCKTWEDCFLIPLKNTSQIEFNKNYNDYNLPQNTLLHGYRVSYDFNQSNSPTKLPTFCFEMPQINKIYKIIVKAPYLCEAYEIRNTVGTQIDSNTYIESGATCTFPCLSNEDIQQIPVNTALLAYRVGRVYVADVPRWLEG